MRPAEHQPPTRPEEIHNILAEFGDPHRLLRDADNDSKAALYNRLVYHPDKNTVRVEMTLDRSGRPDRTGKSFSPRTSPQKSGQGDPDRWHDSQAFGAPSEDSPLIPTQVGMQHWFLEGVRRQWPRRSPSPGVIWVIRCSSLCWPSSTSAAPLCSSTPSPPRWQEVSPQQPRPMLEFPSETTRTVADFLFNGTLERSPGIRFVIPHCGGTLPLPAAVAAQVAALETAPNLDTGLGWRALTTGNARRLLALQPNPGEWWESL